MVQFVGVSEIRRIVERVGIEQVLTRMTDYLEADFRRWERFERAPRLASHSKGGVIELMPTQDDDLYTVKFVNGHPYNFEQGLQTVVALGIMADVATGYPVFLSEMTILTALRTAAMSALAAKHLARPEARTMAIIGLGAQSEFQAVAFRAVLGIDTLRVYDVDPAATAKFLRNMSGRGCQVIACDEPGSAVMGADIVTTVTADKAQNTILSDNMVGAGVHLNAVGGDCPGKTELQKDILSRASVFVELTEQTRIEGEIQQMPADFPVTELWQVISGEAPGRTRRDEITLFDSVGFAVEDFAALRLLRDLSLETGFYETLDLITSPSDPRDLFGMIASPVMPAARAA
ncbi:ornithine cyclodeaminase [Sphingomonas sp. MG17]|uniref:Ornithine cyclodeaminase n=1 Tax=Sphingomonas tagetis TaxID=2949092 RepID=A0A9X2HKM1_9SPHN|nr:ornithine cyclodeaminase [Sphingomonas tagetis]MCP3730904.1 ornithine cyclodeaminase [Sphingomonas tagetis]